MSDRLPFRYVKEALKSNRKITVRICIKFQLTSLLRLATDACNIIAKFAEQCCAMSAPGSAETGVCEI